MLILSCHSNKVINQFIIQMIIWLSIFSLGQVSYLFYKIFIHLDQSYLPIDKDYCFLSFNNSLITVFALIYPIIGFIYDITNRFKIIIFWIIILNIFINIVLFFCQSINESSSWLLLFFLLIDLVLKINISVLVVGFIIKNYLLKKYFMFVIISGIFMTVGIYNYNILAHFSYPENQIINFIKMSNIVILTMMLTLSLFVYEKTQNRIRKYVLLIFTLRCILIFNKENKKILFYVALIFISWIYFLRKIFASSLSNVSDFTMFYNLELIGILIFSLTCMYTILYKLMQLKNFIYKIFIILLILLILLHVISDHLITNYILFTLSTLILGTLIDIFIKQYKTKHISQAIGLLIMTIFLIQAIIEMLSYISHS